MTALDDGFWLVSDLHLGHRKVSELRGSPDTDEHDRVIRRVGRGGGSCC